MDEYKKYKNIIIPIGKREISVNPAIISVGIFLLFTFIAVVPLILHGIGFQDIGLGSAAPTGCGKDHCLLDYHGTEPNQTGPFGIGAAILSVSFTLGVGISIGTYYKLRSQRVHQIRDKNKQLEKEFASALFQLGSRLGDGLPAEMAFGRVASAMEGTVSGSFMSLVHKNITSLGMSVEDAIFSPRNGAIHTFPSNIIQSSMRVLVQSVKKGPHVAAQALMNVSHYIKEIHRVNERLKDLLADTVSSMESQIKFLAPSIAGIVVGITSMVTAILGRLTGLIESAAGGGSASGIGDLAGILGEGMPTYHFQFIVGLYVVQIIVILTILVNAINNGEDDLQKEFLLGKNVTKATILYSLLTMTVMLIFNILAAVVLKDIGGI